MILALEGTTILVAFLGLLGTLALASGPVVAVLLNRSTKQDGHTAVQTATRAETKAQRALEEVDREREARRIAEQREDNCLEALEWWTETTQAVYREMGLDPPQPPPALARGRQLAQQAAVHRAASEAARVTREREAPTDG